MKRKLTKSEWIEILNNDDLTKEQNLSIFQVLYSFKNHQAYGSQIGSILGYTDKKPQGPLNLEIGRYAKRIADVYDISFNERKNKEYKYWDLFFDGWSEGNYFVWKLKPELVEALEETGLTKE